MYKATCGVISETGVKFHPFFPSIAACGVSLIQAVIKMALRTGRGRRYY